MQRRWYKAAFCALTLALAAACASAPDEPMPVTPDPVAVAAAQSECQALAVKYASAVRDAGEATARYGSADRRRIQLGQLQAALREEMTRSGAPDVRLIAATALGAELADAKAERATLEARYGQRHPRAMTADAGVVALEDAIAAETTRSARAG